MKKIKYEEWIDEYLPKTNHLDSNAAYEERMFETYGAELGYILNLANSEKRNTIWTLVSGENETEWIIPGYHIVNRIGYFVTENAWEDENIQVNDNEMIDDISARIACLDFFFKENKGKYVNKVSDYFTLHKDKTFENEMTTGKAKYLAIDCYEHLTGKEITEEQENLIHDYYNQL